MSSNHVVNDTGQVLKETRYRKWLGQVTENAIDNALKLEAELVERVHNVDIQSCGECSNSFIFPLPSISQSQKNSASSSRSRTWTLAKESEDRRQVANKIYALLVLWRPDVSFERRTRVAAAVNIMEEAVYQEAKSKDEYMNPLLLDLRLRRVLCHFEAGNGLFLLQGSSPLYPVRPYDTLLVDPCSSDYSPVVTPAASVGPNILAQMDAESKEGSDDDSLDWESPNLPLKGTVRSLMTSEMRASRKVEANSALLDAVGSGHKRLMEERLHKHGQYASKKIVKRVISMISRRKREENKRLKHELRQAIPEVKPANALAIAKSERPSTEERRQRSGKTLGDMLKFGHPKSEESLHPIDAQGSASGISQVLELEDAYLPNDCTLQIETIRAESNVGNDIEMQNEGSSSSCYSNSEGHAIAERVVSYPFPDDEPLQDGSGESSACSLMNSLGVAAKSADKLGALMEQRGSNVHSGSSLQSLEKAASTRTNMVVRAEYSDCKRASTSYPAAIIPDMVATEERSDSAMASLSSLFASEQALAVNSDMGASVSGQATQGTAQEATAPNTQSSSGVAQEATPLTEESGTGGATLSTARERGTRVPLISFLRESDEYDLFHMETFSCDYAPWDSWEEPTEELDPLCCVCMVGLKGAAFIPCGHTFCRKCSRELWRGRGTCPLCNRNIREILDIY